MFQIRCQAMALHSLENATDTLRIFNWRLPLPIALRDNPTDDTKLWGLNSVVISQILVLRSIVLG